MDHVRSAAIVMAAAAGSITALSFMDWRSMDGWTRVMTFAVGFSFAIFMVPWFAADLLRLDITSLRAVCGVTYAGAAASQALMPRLIMAGKQFLDKWLGEAKRPEDRA